METVRDFIPFLDADRDAGNSAGRGASRAGQPGIDGVDEALATLREVGLTAVEDASLLGFQAAADFAGTVEELSRPMASFEHASLMTPAVMVLRSLIFMTLSTWVKSLSMRRKLSRVIQATAAPSLTPSFGQRLCMVSAKVAGWLR